MKAILVLTTAALVAAAIPAQAQKFDMSTIKCKEFVSSSPDKIAGILWWLQSYYSDEDASPLVDFDKMKTDEKAMGEYCDKNPDHSIRP